MNVGNEKAEHKERATYIITLAYSLSTISLKYYDSPSLCGKVMYPSLLFPHCIIPTQGTTFHLNVYVAFTPRKFPVISLN